MIGFGFGAVWTTVGLGSAILSLVCAGVAYFAVGVLERRRPAARARQRSRQPRRLDVEMVPLAAEGS